MKNKIARRTAIFVCIAILLMTASIVIYAEISNDVYSHYISVEEYQNVQSASPPDDSMNGWGNPPTTPTTQPPTQPPTTQPPVEHPWSCGLFWCRQLCDALGSCICQ